MSPEELTLINTSSQAVTEDPHGFSQSFYDTVFDLAPAARSLFPDDMTEQRMKLINELRFMLAAASALGDATQLEAFIHRTKRLGRRHVGYGVTAAMYEPVGAALIATLRDYATEFDERHELAWIKLFGFISHTMLAGADEAATADTSGLDEGDQNPCGHCAATVRTSALQH